ncbi:uncharacterized protein LOC107371083 isoform X2 [Tetranychus urticae]|uniref:uncharacterized protein LOC107371083 isoform X2 n=1 Tax=Tetranychus urticae TaxID=32264 RepID=UPI000D65711B|nr:uncharacterized protein LOC107371083 isoform X2 [Tetranychus urticae]
MAEAKLAMIEDRIQIFKLLLKAIQESQADLDEIDSLVNKMQNSTIGIFDTVDINQEIANSDSTKFDLRSANKNIEIAEPDFLKIQQKIRDETLKKVVNKGQKDSCSALIETTLENQETPMNEWQRSKIEPHETPERGNSMDKLNGSISHDSSSSDSDSDHSLDNISADLLYHTSDNQQSNSINNSTYYGISSNAGLKRPIKSPKCSVFSLPKTLLAAKRRKQELRWKLTEISQASPKDNEVLTSELSKKKQRTNNIPKLKSVGTTEAKPDINNININTIETRSFNNDPLTMKVICKARNKKAETKVFCLKMSKNDTFVDPENIHMQLKSCMRRFGNDSKSSFVKCHCNMCLSGKPVIGRSHNLLSHLYRTENILLHCCYCDKSTQDMKRMRKHIQKYHWIKGEILQETHVEDEE